MYVVATAGHVDHGKSTLVRALTGIEPDRLAEERSRGMTIELGFAWTTLPTGEQIAFVDVPGHERFVTTMLAGVGPAPAVLLVVAADEGWKPQTEEHVAAIRALGARQILLAVTKRDLTDPTRVMRATLDRLAEQGWPDASGVAVDAHSGLGLDALRAGLGVLVRELPPASLAGPVRLWVDRVFTIRGAGTVVTATLPAGRVAVGDTLALQPSGRQVVVRGLQSLGHDRRHVEAVARVALNLRGVDRADIRRGMALVTPGDWSVAATADAVGDVSMLPAEVTVHVGAAAVPARLRKLGERSVRVALAEPLPLHLGDRLLLRDPSSRRLAPVELVDLHPKPVRRRGDGARIGAELEALALPVTADMEVARRGSCRTDDLWRSGITDEPQDAMRVGAWRVATQTWDEWSRRLQDIAAGDDMRHGIAVSVLRQRIGLPDDVLAAELVRQTPDLLMNDGRVRTATTAEVDPRLTPLLERLERDPLAAPDATELASLGMNRAELAEAVRRGRLVRLADGIYVAPAAADHAVSLLADLPAPFSVSDARQALGGTRRVVVPLLEHLDAARRTRRLPDGTRLLVDRSR